MKKPKIFESLKRKQQDTAEKITPEQKKEEVKFQAVEPTEKKVLAEHHEVLYSGQKNILSDIHQHKNYDGSDHSPKNIESTIDKMGKKSYVASSEIDRKIDRALKKPIPKLPKSRKPANVIYVVSKPQPGQTRGDWAVRSHGKIYSHHRTKENAIKKARQIADEKQATVLIQNMDGTFRTSYKPREQKK